MTTLNLQVGASQDDGVWRPDEGGFINTGSPHTVQGGADSNYRYFFIRFTGVSGIDGATIDNAFLEVFNRDAETSMDFDIWAVDQDDPTAIASAADGNSRPKTTAQFDWNGGLSLDPSAYASTGTNSLSAIISELDASYDYSTSKAIQFLIYHAGTAGQACRWDTFDFGTGERASKLTIDYTPEAPPGGGETFDAIIRLIDSLDRQKQKFAKMKTDVLSSAQTAMSGLIADLSSINLLGIVNISYLFHDYSEASAPLPGASADVGASFRLRLNTGRIVVFKIPGFPSTKADANGDISIEDPDVVNFFANFEPAGAFTLNQGCTMTELLSGKMDR
jgi:hypothetical protein